MPLGASAVPGYAGVLAAAAHCKWQRPMVLTEHGIYTKERRIEINRSDWIQDWDSGELVAERKAPFFRRYWIRQFQMMSRVTYEYADEILTLYTGNTFEQMKDGAAPEKLRIIPNGIDLDRFGEAAGRLDERGENDRFTVCFVGRVCPIKDVMTFVSAMRLVADELPLEAEGEAEGRPPQPARPTAAGDEGRVVARALRVRRLRHLPRRAGGGRPLRHPPLGIPGRCAGRRWPG